MLDGASQVLTKDDPSLWPQCSPAVQVCHRPACLSVRCRHLCLKFAVADASMALMQGLIRTELLNCIKDEKEQTISKKVRASACL